MKLNECAATIRDALSAWVETRGGVAAIVSSYRAMWEQAAQSSQKLIILICYTGERIRGDQRDAAIAGRIDRSWNVAVVRGRGFANIRGDTLAEKVGDADPFFQLVEEVREVLRNLEGASIEYPLEYRAIRPMQLGNTIMDGYIIEFTTADDMDALKIMGN